MKTCDRLSAVAGDSVARQSPGDARRKRWWELKGSERAAAKAAAEQANKATRIAALPHGVNHCIDAKGFHFMRGPHRRHYFKPDDPAAYRAAALGARTYLRPICIEIRPTLVDDMLVLVAGDKQFPVTNELTIVPYVATRRDAEAYLEQIRSGNLPAAREASTRQGEKV